MEGKQNGGKGKVVDERDLIAFLCKLNSILIASTTMKNTRLLQWKSFNCKNFSLVFLSSFSSSHFFFLFPFNTMNSEKDLTIHCLPLPPLTFLLSVKVKLKLTEFYVSIVAFLCVHCARVKVRISQAKWIIWSIKRRVFYVSRFYLILTMFNRSHCRDSAEAER